ncbi:MAG: phenylalanine--tRNA ligase subunit alpha [Thermoplasmata archaeon]
MPEASGDAPVGAAPVALSGPERSLLLALREREGSALDEESLEREVGLPADQVRGSLQRLRSKHLALVEEEHETIPRLTPKGEGALARGLPERRFLDALSHHGGSLTPDEVTAAGLDDEERSAAIGVLRRRGFLAEGPPFRLKNDARVQEAFLPEETVLRQVSEGATDVDPAIVDALERRGLVRRDHRSIKRWSASEEGRRLPIAPEGEELLGSLTSDLLRSGDWRGRTFRPYDVRAAVPYLTGARPNPYIAWLEEFEEVLVGLGFEQAEGPLLETEFWNNDALFMPQDHPARSIHDALSVEGVEGRPPAPDLLARVAAVHEGRPLPGTTAPLGPGWPGSYDVRVAVRPVLRSQTTAVSARYLARNPRPPFRMFSIDRNFRREEVDARHHLEFHQCEGIIGEEGLDLRHLVGVFTTLADAIGLREIKFRPSYFPFTEPSIEGYVRHPRLGWMEVFPGGVLRPEVLRPLGVDVPVLAWGIGVMRLAMVSLGCNDIRELFQDDLATLTGGSP